MRRNKPKKDILSGKRILLGVTGGIAAYKAAHIASALRARDAEIIVIMTQSAQQFITPLTLHTLTGGPVITDMFDQRSIREPAHVSIAESVDAIVVAPATANFIGKLASGICDDMLTCTIMAAEVPLIVAPAMNEAMFRKPVLQENIEKLRSWGVRFVGPEKGRLATGKVGMGRMSQPEKIIEELVAVLSGQD